jgi:hypothetical protein
VDHSQRLWSLLMLELWFPRIRRRSRHERHRGVKEISQDSPSEGTGNHFPRSNAIPRQLLTRAVAPRLLN